MKKIFFGWYIVAAALVLTTYNSAMFIYGFTAFLTPIAATFGWTFAQLSLASSIRGLETGALDPFIGMAADRWPAKRLIFIGIIILVLGIMFISQATNLAMYYVGFMIVGLGGAISITMVPTTVIARWFKGNIGKANGILAAGFAIGGLFAPLIVKGIDTFGWQNLMLYMAGGILILGLPLSFVFRNRPEDYGLLPDGKAPVDAKGLSTYDLGMDRKQALKTRAFWYIGISQMFQMGAMQSVALHQMPYLTSLGLQRANAAVAITIFSLVGLIARLLYGFLADIFPKKYILAISNGIITAGLIVFGLLDGSSFTFVVLFAVIYGIGAGGATPLRAPIIRDYFGVKHFGTIYGVLTLFMMFGGVVCAPLTGWVFDIRGVYDPIWFVYAGLTAMGTGLLLLLPRPFSLDKEAPEGMDV